MQGNKRRCSRRGQNTSKRQHACARAGFRRLQNRLLYIHRPDSVSIAFFSRCIFLPLVEDPYSCHLLGIRLVACAMLS